VTTPQTPMRTPPDQPSDEATHQGLRLAKEAGEAYQRMVRYFIEHVATSGKEQQAGNYRLGVAVEHAEPLYYLVGGELVLADPPQGANAHVEVVVTDAADGRFVPGLRVYVTLRTQAGAEVGTFQLPFLWHPTMYHYGANIQVPGDGQYTLRVAINVPTFPRHDKVNGKRYSEPVIAEFSGLTISTGRK
jgi:hypothetical protein